MENRELGTGAEVRRMLAFIVLWVVVILTGAGWAAARSSRLGAETRTEVPPEPPVDWGAEVEIPDTVPTEWVRAYRDE